jgi:hypothetical protein
MIADIDNEAVKEIKEDRNQSPHEWEELSRVEGWDLGLSLDLFLGVTSNGGLWHFPGKIVLGSFLEGEPRFLAFAQGLGLAGDEFVLEESGKFDQLKGTFDFVGSWVAIKALGEDSLCSHADRPSMLLTRREGHSRDDAHDDSVARRSVAT